MTTLLFAALHGLQLALLRGVGMFVEVGAAVVALALLGSARAHWTARHRRLP